MHPTDESRNLEYDHGEEMHDVRSRFQSFRTLLLQRDNGWEDSGEFTYEEARAGGFFNAGDETLIRMCAKVSERQKQKMGRCVIDHDHLVDGRDTSRAPSAHHDGVKDK